ncbi:permease-like cell division protein FtsX [Streptomyces caniscabiei]|uniref:cell division protein FtsX n=1 Tax=Streptomyces caniscabiei TaxID=2746961 RepID=UPI0029ABD9E0|nr:permease-like cell division protein FtsX [Streptomyces caniscabiei]MDX2776201.1 permease-like cell division protein FtsX [Streptomyces caniscabiei]
MSKRKLDAKAFSQQKRKRRQWITFVRMCRYGINNFSRNAWLTIAATAVMTITLLVVFVTLAARNVLVDTVDEIRDKVDMSIYVKTDIKEADVKKIQADLEKLSTVRAVTYVSPAQARESFAEQNKGDAGTLDALNEATNQFPGTFRISPVDINDTSELQKFVETNDTVKKNLDPNREPSFAGERKSAIENIGRWVEFAERAGLVASAIFIAISSLIVFNTIRMAIFNRKDEIQMMKLIGADRNFIRGPFIVEAIVYGFIAAVVATVLGVVILYASAEKLLSYGVLVDSTIGFVTSYIGFVLLGMILLGAIIGVISSLLATRRYLKI